METTQRDIPQESLKPASEPAKDEVAGAQIAQAETPAAPSAPAPDAGRAAAAAGAGADDEGPGAGSVLGEFLADGPPQLPEEGEDGQAGEQRPVRMQPEGQDAGPPVETAADDGGPVSGGVSFYRDTFGALDPNLAPSETGAEPPLGIAPEGDDPILADQFGTPVVLSSLAAVEPAGSVLDVPVPPPAPIPADPDPEPDPLTERRIAEGLDEDGDAEDDDETGSSIAGTPGNDNLAGTDQGDTLTGGDGDDTLAGGGGADVFSFSLAGNQGDDVITDFTTGSGGDTLQLSDVADASGDGTVELADLDSGGANAVTGTAGSLVLDFASGASVTLAGVDGTGIATFADLEASEVNTDVS